MRKVIAVLLAVLFLVTLASTTVSATGTPVPYSPHGPGVNGGQLLEPCASVVEEYGYAIQTVRVTDLGNS